MNLAELQADLRHFAAERDWQPFHTPKNLSTALMVEASELAEIFQWMTPGESFSACQDRATKGRIGEEIADVLLYLLQLADHGQIDIALAVRDKLARNALKYPAKQTIARAAPAPAAPPGTHVLLDYENVQPTERDLRAMVPDASKVWVFHGPHQRQVDQRFASFGADVTVVPISKTGRNALDFHLSFYMGYIASRDPASAFVVVANDKGYAPMLAHAKAMGFAVRQLGHAHQAPSVAPMKAAPAEEAGSVIKPAVAAKKPPAKKAAIKQAKVEQVPAKKAAAKTSVVAPAAKRLPAAKGAPAKKAVASPPGSISTDSLKKIVDNLRKMGDARPVKAASLRRALKSFLSAETGDASIELALGKLVAEGVVSLGATGHVSYPGLTAFRLVLSKESAT